MGGASNAVTKLIRTLEVDWQRVYEGLERGARFAQGFLLPDFVTRAKDIWRGMVESVTMTVCSTIVGVLISIPIGVPCTPYLLLTCSFSQPRSE